MYRLMIVWACLWSTAVVGQEESVEQFLQRLEEFNAETTSIVSSFDQVQVLSFLDEEMKASGSFYFMKPSAMKWEQVVPEAYSFVITEDEAYKSDVHGTKKIPSNSPQIIGFKKFLLETMDGSILKSDDFENEIELVDGDAKITLLPKQKAMKRMFREVRLVFDVQSLLLKELVFQETPEDYRSIYFSNHKLNTLTDRTQFTR
ncbi:hypothetical protein BFP72_12575 [Reichenbachiella sp. 5M10]|uniref:outer membrane lipoprotein carrier protein LolA n=1 Tax=Reichenbachiella sp. 5M10 TaxID=1889772 RepID=UPI000C152ED8|nr:outer membrane lipoprotein carrier protein LolA [Reichenbachiella sp. 5M10]PIB36171.1 hypothetical protein BFP72_12575 [Reichenbachiella sp. 5M10]